MQGLKLLANLSVALVLGVLASSKLGSKSLPFTKCAHVFPVHSLTPCVTSKPSVASHYLQDEAQPPQEGNQLHQAVKTNMKIIAEHAEPVVATPCLYTKPQRVLWAPRQPKGAYSLWHLAAFAHIFGICIWNLSCCPCTSVINLGVMLHSGFLSHCFHGSIHNSAHISPVGHGTIYYLIFATLFAFQIYAAF